MGSRKREGQTDPTASALDGGLRQLIISQLPAMVWVLDRDLRVTSLEGRVPEGTGLSREAVMGLDVRQVVQPELHGMLGQVLEGRGTRLRVVRGSVTFEHTLEPFRDAEGQIVGILGISVDISEQVAAERRVAESEALFRTTFEQAAVGMALCDLDGRFLRVNAEFCRITGYSAEELKQRAFAAITHPDDVEADLAEVRRMLSGETSQFSRDKRYIRKDGTVAWANLIVTARQEAGQPVELLAVAKDITARVRTVQALEEERAFNRAVFDGTGALLMVMDAHGRIVQCNEACLNLLGYEVEEVLGRTPWDLCVADPDERADVARRYRELPGMSCEEAVQRFPIHTERTWRIRNGERRCIALSTTYQPAPDGTVRYVIASGIDVTERRAAEQQLRQTNELLERVFRQAHGSFALLDRDFRFIRVNEQYAQGAGLPVHALLGKRHFDLFPGEEAEAIFVRVRDTGQPYEVSARPFENPQTPGVGTTWWNWSLTALADPTGRTAHLLLSLHDVTEFKRAEQRLAENEQRLEETQRIAHLGSWNWDLSTDALRWSDETYRIFGMEPGSVEMTYDAFLARVHPDDRPAVERAVREALQGGRPYRWEHRIVLPDGSVRHVLEQGEVRQDEHGHGSFMMGAVLDVTERTEARLALEESSRLLREAQRIAHLGSWEWYPATDEVHWSDETFRILGLEPGEIEPSMEHFEAVVHPDDRARISAARETARPKGQVPSITYRIIRRDGEVRWLQTQGESAYDPNGGAVLVTGAVLDVTEQHQTELALQENERRLEEAQRIAHLGSWTWDIPTGKLTWSDEIFRIFGITPGAVDSTYARFLERIHPDDRAAVEQAVSDALAGTKPYNCAHRVVRPDGSVRHVLEQGEVRRDHAGEPVGMVGTVLDVTERELALRALEAERNFSAAVFDSTPALIIVHDRDGRIVRFNEASAAVSGYAPDELMGRYTWEVLPAGEEQRTAVRERFAAMADLSPEAALERFGRQVERIWRTKDGRERRIAWSLAYLPDEDGKVAYQVASGLDVTESRAAEAALRESEARYERAVRGSNDGIWDWNIETGEDFLSPRWLEMLGYGPGDLPARVETFQDLLHPDDAEVVADAVRRHLEDDATFDVECRLRRKDGGYLWTRSRGRAVRNEAGKPVRMAGSLTDITAAREAEAEIRRLNETLEQRVRERTAELAEERNFTNTVLDTQEALVVVLDRQGRIVRFNRACEVLTGYGQSEVLGRKVWEFLVPEEQREAVGQVFDRLKAGDFPNTHENPWLNRDGQPVLIAWSNSAIVDESEEVLFVIATGIDVTQQREAQNAIRIQAQVIDQARGVAVTADPHGRVTSWNRHAEAFLGYKAQDVLGRHVSFMYRPGSHEAEMAIDVLRERGEAVLEQVLRTKDGRERPVLLSLSHLRNSQGEPIGMVGFAVDITERVQAEAELAAARERLSFLLTASPAIIFAAAASGDFGATFVSENVRDALGYEPDQFTADPAFWVDHLHEDDRQRVLDGLSVLFEEGRNAQEYRFRAADGRYRWMREECRLVRDSAGAPQEVVGVWLDVSERVEAEQRVARMQAQMAVQQKMATVGQLTATVSHELRNPLGTIRTSVFSLKERLSQEDPAHLRTLDRIERNVLRCDNIINDLLDFSRTRDGNPEPTEIGAWLGELLAEQQRPDWLQMEQDIGLPGVVLHLDQDRLRRAVINVVENAIQAMQQAQRDVPTPAGTIAVRCALEPERLVIRVRDTGPGMTPEVLARIFEPLYSTKTYGVGLGLPTVKQIMEQEGGGVDIHSWPGDGTEVVLWLPLQGRMQGVA